MVIPQARNSLATMAAPPQLPLPGAVGGAAATASPSLDDGAHDSAPAGETFKVGDAVLFSGRDGERAERTTTFAARVLEVLGNGQYVIRNVLKTKTSSRVVDSERLEPAPQNINPMNEMYSPSSRGDIGWRSRRNQELSSERSARVAVEAENKKLQQQIGEEQQQLKKAKAKVKDAKAKARVAEKQAAAATMGAKLSANRCVAEVARVNATAVELMNAAVAERTSELEAKLAQQKKDSMAALKKHEEKSNKRVVDLTSKHMAAMAKVLRNYSDAACEAKERGAQVDQLEKRKQALEVEHQREQDALQE